MKEPELEGCPLCSSFRIRIVGTKVVCLECGCNTGEKETVTQAVSAWNNRKKLPSD